MKPSSPRNFAQKLTALGKLKIKIIGGGNLTTRLHVEADRSLPKRAEYSATWQCTWEDGTLPLLASVQVEKFETVHSTGPWMQDLTSSVIGHNPRFAPQVLRGMEFWTQRITRIGDLAMTGHRGIAVGDVNGDGLEDLDVCDGGSLPNQLYLQQADGTANEVAADWGVAWPEDSRSALLVDLDNDGDQDLVVATIAKEAGVEDVGAGMSVSWGDPNRDGAADLLIGNMFSSAGRRVASQGHLNEGLTRMARGNSLFNGNGQTFKDRSESAGLTNGG